MKRFEYQVVPLIDATSGKKKRNKTAAEMLEARINEAGAKGWEFQRIERIQAWKKRWLRPARLVETDMLIFRRASIQSAMASADRMVAQEKAALSAERGAAAKGLAAGPARKQPGQLRA